MQETYENRVRLKQEAVAIIQMKGSNLNKGERNDTEVHNFKKL